MWRNNDSIYSTFSPLFFPLEVLKVKLFSDYTTQLDRLITPSIPPIPYTHWQAGAGKWFLPAYRLLGDKDYNIVRWLHFISGSLADALSISLANL